MGLKVTFTIVLKKAFIYKLVNTSFFSQIWWLTWNDPNRDLFSQGRRVAVHAEVDAGGGALVVAGENFPGLLKPWRTTRVVATQQHKVLTLTDRPS